MTGREAVDSDQFFQLSACEYNLRGHSMKLSKQRANFDVRKFSSVNVWCRSGTKYFRKSMNKVCEPVQEQR